ncbi:hypothetical protein LNKW23_42550 [Paralimibaculum aggregatum]|uniref:LysR substrate-binding domain-containing protein n=1 Tax=Paralimibaculum aggregatum TaxID=3036245 RepID=A0ABQ6LSI8_9RHOB|nr:hypothetical protein LNKW23_42550 [Limibaculum sp. NKW23]
MRPAQKGAQLLHAARSAVDALDRQILAPRGESRRSVTPGLSTYVGSRWLSPRLMGFSEAHPAIRLRPQPMIGRFDPERDRVDVAIRRGRGERRDMPVTPLFACPAWPAASPALAGRIGGLGRERSLGNAILLDDRDGSTAWQEWLERVGLPQHASGARLTIPDPDLRVQTVIDGQGVAINGRPVQPGLDDGRLRRLSPAALGDYGRHPAIPPRAAGNPDVAIPGR